MKYNSTIEYIAILVAYLGPFYLAAMIYELIKVKNYSYLNILKLVVSIGLIGVAYIYLQPKQRLFVVAYVLVLAIVMAIAMLLGRLFKRLL